MNKQLISFEELCNNVNKIIIPKIQRDYAQGRKVPNINKGREKFISDIFNILKLDNDKNELLKLDFVYGSITDGIFIPLDGQQRLTTLFLLYFYIGKRNNEPYKFLSKFTYEVRESSNNFCKKLCGREYEIDWNTIGAEKQYKNFSDYLRDQKWFLYDWKNDSTIDSMLTVLDCINEHYLKLTGVEKENAISNLNNIKFYFLPISDLGTTDDIYIKMNSRGKSLTDFELFKSEFDKTLKSLGDTETIEKIDTCWTDLLWNYAKETDDKVIDPLFLHYFKFICCIIYYTNYKYYSIDNLPLDKFYSLDEFDLLERFFKDGENISILNKYFDCWIRQDDSYDFSHTFFSNLYYYIKWDENPINCSINKELQILAPKENYNLLKEAFTRNLEKDEIILLYFIIKYLNEGNFSIPDDNFKVIYRAIKNILKYSNLNKIKLSDLLPLIDKISTDKIDILLNELEKCDNKIFCNNKIKEEKAIADYLRNEDKTIRQKIYNLEDSYYLNGQLSVLAYNYDSKNSFDIKQCFDVADTFCNLFYPKKCDNLNDYLGLVSCCLCKYGDYGVPENGWRYLYGSRNPKTWQKLFNIYTHDDKNRIEKFKMTSTILHKFLISLKEEIINQNLLKSICDDYVEHTDKYDLNYYFVNLKYKKFFHRWHGKCFFEEGESKKIHVRLMMTRYYQTTYYDPFQEQINDMIENNSDKIILHWKKTKDDYKWTFSYKNQFIEVKDGKQKNKPIDIELEFSFNKDMIKEALKQLQKYFV